MILILTKKIGACRRSFYYLQLARMCKKGVHIDGETYTVYGKQPQIVYACESLYLGILRKN